MGLIILCVIFTVICAVGMYICDEFLWDKNVLNFLWELFSPCLFALQ